MSGERLVDEAYRLCIRLEELYEKPYFTPGGRRHDLINQLGAESHFARLRRIRRKAIKRHNRRLDLLIAGIGEEPL